MTKRINVWSSPRNLSTALMYSWRERADTTVVDEPLYAHFLEVTGKDYGEREATLASQDRNGHRVVREVMLGPYDTEVVFFKQMAKHLVELDRSFLSRFDNVLLTREPADMVASFSKGVPEMSLDDTGFVELTELLEWLVDHDHEPIVVESGQLLQDPPAVLAELCHRLDLDFDRAMLSWPAGPKPEDGVWGSVWYEGVRRSTGWEQRERRKPPELKPHLALIVEQSRPYYERLSQFMITAGS